MKNASSKTQTESLSFAPEQELPADNTGVISRPGANIDALTRAKIVLRMEADEILSMSGRLTEDFNRAIDLLYNCQGKVVVTGIGKSGHIGSKLAATFASTGTSAFFVHPAELRHGDFGMLSENDVVLILSATGETPEIKVILDPLKRLGVKTIALTGGLKSSLAKFSDVTVDVAVSREACPLNLAPTSSTTATLAMGDALAVVLMERKDFRAEDFARSHPGGSLGKRLLQVKDVMRMGIQIPTVAENANYTAVLSEIDAKKLGFTTVLDGEQKVIGVISDGDLRRSLIKFGGDCFSKAAAEIMTRNPKTVSSESLASEALKLMEKHSIANLVIVDSEFRPAGLIDLKDLLHAGLI